MQVGIRYDLPSLQEMLEYIYSCAAELDNTLNVIRFFYRSQFPWHNAFTLVKAKEPYKITHDFLLPYYAAGFV